MRDNLPIRAQWLHREFAKSPENKESIFDVEIIDTNELERTAFGDTFERFAMFQFISIRMKNWKSGNTRLERSGEAYIVTVAVSHTPGIASSTNVTTALSLSTAMFCSVAFRFPVSSMVVKSILLPRKLPLILLAVLCIILECPFNVGVEVPVFGSSFNDTLPKTPPTI